MDKLFTLTQPLPNTLETLIRQTEIHQHLLEQLRQQLPTAVQHSLTNCVIQEKQLLVIASNTAVLNRLRLHQYQFLNTVNQEYPEVTEIIYLLTTPHTESSTPRSLRDPQSPVDERTTQAINNLAEHIDDDGLSNSLKILSRVLSQQR